MANLDISRAPRLDLRLLDIHPTLTRSYAAKLVADGKVTVNDQIITKVGYKVRPDDVVAVDYDPRQFEQIPVIELPVLYEDADCVVINKPAGVLTHSKGAFNPEATVASWLRGRLTGMSGERAGIVHRLDRATSGVMIAAKTPAAHAWLQKQFAQRRVHKSYEAVVSGRPDPAEAVIDMPVERNPKQPQTFRVGVNGKPAVTNYQTDRTDGRHSLLTLRPLTGRTHQLRVHLKQLGHPIVGDVLYGGEPAGRLYLHAKSLEITLPGRQRQVFCAAVPAGFGAYLDA